MMLYYKHIELYDKICNNIIKYSTCNFILHIYILYTYALHFVCEYYIKNIQYIII